jgi:hypothetical protein
MCGFHSSEWLRVCGDQFRLAIVVMRCDIKETKEAPHSHRHTTSIDLQRESISAKLIPVTAVEACTCFPTTKKMEIIRFHYFSRAGLSIALRLGTPKTFLDTAMQNTIQHFLTLQCKKHNLPSCLCSLTSALSSFLCGRLTVLSFLFVFCLLITHAFVADHCGQQQQRPTTNACVFHF